MNLPFKGRATQGGSSEPLPLRGGRKGRGQVMSRLARGKHHSLLGQEIRTEEPLPTVTVAK